jgi:hypothetical protein
MEIFSRLFNSLNRGGVEYLVCGGIAVNLYGIERATADIDLAVRLDEENLKAFVRVVNQLGLKPKMPVSTEDIINPEKRREWLRDKGMFVFSLYDEKNPFFLLDVFIEDQFDFRSVYQRRHEILFGDSAIPLIPIDELIKMKEKTGRPQDRADVFYLKKIMEEWNNG